MRRKGDERPKRKSEGRSVEEATSGGEVCINIGFAKMRKHRHHTMNIQYAIPSTLLNDSIQQKSLFG